MDIELLEFLLCPLFVTKQSSSLLLKIVSKINKILLDFFFFYEKNGILMFRFSGLQKDYKVAVQNCWVAAAPIIYVRKFEEY